MNQVEAKKCRYYNNGHCKYKAKFRYFHATSICKRHMENQKCNLKGCTDRHPKICKWYNQEVGCRRKYCDFIHVTLALADDKPRTHLYECAGCKNKWEDVRHVVKHEINHKKIFLCLNYDD